LLGLPESSLQLMNSSAIDAHVRPPKPRGRPNRDGSVAGPQVQFEIIDKAHEGASAFGMQVVGVEPDHPGTGQLPHGSQGGLPRLGGISLETKGFDWVVPRRGIAADTVG